MSIPVVDIFAGPGGLGEGFSAYAPAGSSRCPFKIAVSAEMEVNAAKTLRLRAFFRQFDEGKAPRSYYDYVSGRVDQPWTDATARAWRASGEEAQQLTLGEPEDDSALAQRIAKTTSRDKPWVLVGGPPCQAYSIVGRARNRGVAGYNAKGDHRHFLYKHYLAIIEKFRPAVFVMENVKGILSSRVDGVHMFPRILEDLHRPGGKAGPRYRIVPLIQTEPRLDGGYDAEDYILRAEELGVPQARHRVVLLGVAEDVSLKNAKFMQPIDERYSVWDVIGGLPHLRSGVTNLDDENWAEVSSHILMAASKASFSKSKEVSEILSDRARQALSSVDATSGGRWVKKSAEGSKVPKHLKSWLIDPRLTGHLNHEVRRHMDADLMRYAFAAAHAQLNGRSPRGAGDFPRKLYPAHENWESGKFIDRFRVQVADLPSSTVTSHLAKDGHYFIHPDPSQLRSLSIREAARLQTFPDNYFFEGSRGAQFRQVGNAVPPWMARQIARTVDSIIR